MTDKKKRAKDKPKAPRTTKEHLLEAAQEETARLTAQSTDSGSAVLDISSGGLTGLPGKSGSYVPPPLPEHTVHVVIVGRTIAGWTAALRVARRGLSVVLLDPDGPQPVGLSSDIVWTSAAGLTALRELQLHDALPWHGPASVAFIHAAQDKYAAVEQPPKVHMIATESLLGSLEHSALEAGVKRQKGTLAKILLKDNLVQVHLAGGAVVCASLLIYADNTIGKPVLEAAHLQTPLMSLRPNWTLYKLKIPAKGSPGPSLAIIVGWRGSPLLGSAWTDDGVGILALPEDHPSSPEPAGKLVASMIAHKILPAGATLDAVSIERRAFAPGASLDFDQHFGKRCVLAGQCGGFSAALSGEAVFSGLRSGYLAGEVCAKAWECRHPQDILAQFDTQWRTTLADYVRMPNTDLSFILPVVFSNPQMAAKIAAGFINGENL